MSSPPAIEDSPTARADIRPPAQPTPANNASGRVWLRRVIFYALLLLLWEGIARSGIWPEYLFPGPLTVFQTLWAGLQSGALINGAIVSLRRVLVGFAISLFVGVPLGLLIGRVRLIDQTLGSLVIGMQALPSVCWLPLTILWFGLNERAVIAVVVLGALFSIILGVESGVKNTPPLYINAARTLGTRGLALYTQVILPAALPAVLGGLKQGWAFAWRSLMAGELLFFSLSLGNLLQVGRDLNDVAQVMAVMLMIVVVGLTIDQLIFAPLERRVRKRWGLGI